MNKDITLRIPESWLGQVDSARVGAWLAEWCRRPVQLGADPGPGDGRTTLCLPRRAVKILAAATEQTASAALRSLIAAHTGRPSAPPAIPAPVTPVRMLAGPPELSVCVMEPLRFGEPARRRPVYVPAETRAQPAAVAGVARFQAFCLVGLFCVGVAWKLLARVRGGTGTPAPEAPAVFKAWVPKG